jgi:processive 1,2-diacylglycerol beta-glucosyltransferase
MTMFAVSQRFKTIFDLLWPAPSDVPTGTPYATHMPAPAAAKTKRVLVLSVSAGAGHVRAAEAICSHAQAMQEEVSVTHLDVMDYVPATFRTIYTDFYVALINKYPALWGMLYDATNDAPQDTRMQRVRRAVERLNTHALRRKIAALAPDAIVCTHFLPAEVLARMLRTQRLTCPVWVQVTDFDLHRLWIQDGMAGYFAANEEVAFRMRAQGIAAEKIAVTGSPIMPTFGLPLSRTENARALGLDPARTTVLLMGGGAGIGRLEQIAERLLACEGDFQLIALAGRNEATFAALKALAARYPQRLRAHGYTQRIERLMACADLAVTKPGGLTTSECLAMGLPMIINDPIPGQEERNANFLLEQGVALKASDPITLEYRIRHLLAQPQQLAAMRQKALSLAHPHAARDVLAIVTGRQHEN